MLWRRRPEKRDNETELLRNAAAEVHAELSRADTKASMLLALAGAVAAVLASTGVLAGEGVAVWFNRAGLALLVAVVVVLLSTVRPRLGSAPFVRAAAADWKPETPRERMKNLSAVVRAKFRRIRLAVDLLAMAVVVLAIGAVCMGVI